MVTHMRQPWVALVTLVFLLLMGWAQLATYYPFMPPRIASSFDLAGKPEGWAGKNEFCLTCAGTLLAVAAAFVGLGLGNGKIPDRLVSLPNKDYWLAPERRDDTHRFLSVWLLWMGNATLVLVMASMHLVVAANSRPPPDLGASLWGPVAGYLLFAAAWCAVLCWRLRRPAGAASGGNRS